jgi:hypothetical protein
VCPEEYPCTLDALSRKELVGPCAGIYFVRIAAVSMNDPNNGFVQMKKMLLSKQAFLIVGHSPMSSYVALFYGIGVSYGK